MTPRRRNSSRTETPGNTPDTAAVTSTPKNDEPVQKHLQKDSPFATMARQMRPSEEQPENQHKREHPHQYPPPLAATAGRRKQKGEEPDNSAHQIDGSGSTPRRRSSDIATSEAEMGNDLQHLYSMAAPLPPPSQRRRNLDPYHLHASGADLRSPHPPAARTATGEGEDRRSGRRRSEGRRDAPFSPLLTVARGKEKRELSLVVLILSLLAPHGKFSL